MKFFRSVYTPVLLILFGWAMTVPYYPIVVILLLPLTQSITYLISWRQNY